MKEFILFLIIYLIGVALSFSIIVHIVRKDIKEEGLVRLKLWQCVVLAIIVLFSWIGVCYCCVACWDDEIIEFKKKEE